MFDKQGRGIQGPDLTCSQAAKGYLSSLLKCYLLSTYCISGTVLLVLPSLPRVEQCGFLGKGCSGKEKTKCKGSEVGL